MVILLSPAKTLDFESDLTFKEYSRPVFGEETAYLADKLKKLSVKKIVGLMDISENLAQLNAARFADMRFPTEKEKGRQAIFAFKGDVYIGLEAENFSTEDLHYAQDHLRILSGLYGMLRPLDLMQPYRLEMGTPFRITAAKNNLYAFWKAKLTKHLNEELKAEESGLVLNLASQEYFKAIDGKKIKANIITPEFKEERGGKFQMISFFAKKARGMMAAYVIKNKINQAEDLKGFGVEGYTFNERLSDGGKNKWVFTRKSQ